MQLRGAAAIVTGGASGLGRVTAEALHRGGASVVIVDLPNSVGASVAASLGETARFVAGDVREESAAQKAIDLAGSLAPLRIVVNCAGIAPAVRTVGRSGAHPLDVFERAVAINLVGSFNMSRLAAFAMRNSPPVSEPSVPGAPHSPERGVIINTASIAAFDGQMGQVAYAASKGAIAAMTLPMARDLAKMLIRVVTIAPGLFETPMLAAMPDEVRASLAAEVPHPARLGHPTEFAALVQHIVENPMLNGETIRLDGAVRLPPQ